MVDDGNTSVMKQISFEIVARAPKDIVKERERKAPRCFSQIIFTTPLILSGGVMTIRTSVLCCYLENIVLRCYLKQSNVITECLNLSY